MKKSLATILVLALILSLCACGNKTEDQTDPAVQSTTESDKENVPNPIVEKESVDEINEALGCNMTTPGVMGVTDEQFYIINNAVGQYDFTVNGAKYSLRFKNSTDDICGIYTANGTLLQSAEDGQVVSAEGHTGARWFKEEGQYSLTTDGDVDESAFAAIVEEFSGIPAAQPADGGFAGIPNPMKSMASLDEINEALGCELVSPGVMGITDEAFFVTGGTMGEYDFTVAGNKYTFRFADSQDDISGVYTAGGTLLQNAAEKQVVSADGYTGARWFTEDGQYTLITDGNVDADTFSGIIDELMSIQKMQSAGTEVMELTNEATNDPKDNSNESWYENLAGDWQDNYSGRATMTVENGVDHAHVTVTWGDSASCVYEWIMDVTMGPEEADGTNKLSYKDGIYRKVDNDGKTETVTILYENGEGWFTLNQGGFLLWDGAVEENCTECVFEKM